MRKLIVAAVSILIAMPCLAASISEARAVMAQFDAELKMALDANAQNDAAGLQQHQRKAVEYLKQARDLYDKSGAASSRDVDIVREYAAVLIKTGDFDLAAEVLRRGTGLAPKDAGMWRELGRALGLMGHGEAAESVRALQESIKLEPEGAGAATAYANLGRVYRQEGLFDLVRESLDKAISLDVNCVTAKVGLAAANVQDGAMREAADALEKLGTLPIEVQAQLPSLLGDAVTHFQSSHRTFADTAENHLAYGKILFQIGRISEAVEAAERSAKLGPDAYATWNFLGDLSLQLRRTERAREAYKRSLELKADQPMTQERLQSLDQAAAQ